MEDGSCCAMRNNAGAIDDGFGRNQPICGKITHTMRTGEQASTHLPELTIHKLADSIRVIFNNDPDDWIAEYRKTDSFPARQWAERIIDLYEQRQPHE